MARLLSVNVGMPKDVAWQGKTVHTGVWKAPVAGPCMVRRLNIDGDGQGDLAGHGGEHRAVLVYQQDSYRFWQTRLGRSDLSFGQFGENFTVDGLADADVCIGDRYRIGNALFEVTQPRVTCYRVGIRMNEPQMAALLVKENRPGFYLRVLEEGEVAAGDEIVRVATGAEGMSVAEIDALLYKPGHPRAQLERAMRIPALSEGWRQSIAALLDQARAGQAATGNAGLTGLSSPSPAWHGFRPLRVARKIRESANVVSLILEPADGHPLAVPLPGQFLVLRLGSSSPLTRSYSLSGTPSAAQYRVSVKREAHGAASAFVADRIEPDDIIGTSAPRGDFTLRSGTTPVILMSAGIGVTPVLAMLHALSSERSSREIWWLYGARNGAEHPFAAEVRDLIHALGRGRCHIRYSAPNPQDRPGEDFDSTGHLDAASIQALGVPLDGDVYMCGPSAFMDDLGRGLSALGIAPDRIHTEAFGAGPSLTPGIIGAPRRAPHPPAGEPGMGPLITFARSGLNVRWRDTAPSLLDFAEACDVPVRWSCRSGVCHNCESGLLAGAVDYRPEPIDPAADGNILICCSRPHGDIVLDL